MDKHFKDYKPYANGIDNDAIILSKAIEEIRRNLEKISPNFYCLCALTV